MPITRANAEVIDCTWFDVKKPCSVCQAKPAMRKTSKCAPHSVVPYDQSRENDWIDCYEGCTRHDPIARRRYMERLNSSQKNQEKKWVAVQKLQPASMPTLARLMAKSRQGADLYRDLYSKILIELIESRGIVMTEMAREMGVNASTLNNRIHGQQSVYIGDYMAILDYIAKWDTEFKQREKPESKRR